MKPIKIVTAFFDIGRDKSKVYARSAEQYLVYFKFWARIRNNLVVYCQPEYAERITAIRGGYGLLDKTEIIVVDDVFSIEPELFKRMVEVEQDFSFTSFRYYNNAMSNGAKYDYIMLLKWWFVADVAKRTSDDCFLAWLDFGYNHGGKHYTKSEDFDFLWEYDFPKRINVFCLSDPAEVSLIDSLQFQYDCFIGHTVVIPSCMCEHYWGRIKNSMCSLLRIGCIDDDQMLQLMVYKQEPSMHSIVICNWFEDFERCSNHKFTVAEKKEKEIKKDIKRVNLIKRITNKLLWCYRRLKYPDYPQKSDFIRRMEDKQRKYYG